MSCIIKEELENDLKEFIKNLKDDENYDIFIQLKNSKMIGCHIAILLHSSVLKKMIKELYGKETQGKKMLELVEYNKDDFAIVKKWMYGRELDFFKELNVFEKLLRVYKIAVDLKLDDLLKWIHSKVTRFTELSAVKLLCKTYKIVWCSKLFSISSSIIKNNHESVMKDEEVKKFLINDNDVSEILYYISTLPYNNEVLKRLNNCNDNWDSSADVLLMNHISRLNEIDFGEALKIYNNFNSSISFFHNSSDIEYYDDGRIKTRSGYLIFNVVFTNRCEYYKKLLHGRFKESESSEVEIGYDCKMFEIIEKYLYFKKISLHRLCLSKLEKMLKLTDKLQLIPLFNMVINGILKKIKDEFHSGRNTVISIGNNDPNLQACLEILDYIKFLLANFGNVKYVERMKKELKKIEKECCDVILCDKKVSLNLIHKYYKSLDEIKQYSEEHEKKDSQIKKLTRENKKKVNQIEDLIYHINELEKENEEKDKQIEELVSKEQSYLENNLCKDEEWIELEDSYFYQNEKKKDKIKTNSSLKKRQRDQK